MSRTTFTLHGSAVSCTLGSLRHGSAVSCTLGSLRHGHPNRSRTSLQPCRADLLRTPKLALQEATTNPEPTRVQRILLRVALAVAILLTAAALPPAVHAQVQRHSVQLGATYTFVRTNLVPGCNCFGMEGGSGLFTMELSPRVQALGEVDVTHQGHITRNGYDLTQTVFTGGVRYTPLFPRAHVLPFADILVGGAHAGGSLSPANTALGGSFAFAFQTGGGVQLHTRRLTLIPAQADYLLTTFGNGTGANRQNDLRLSAGFLVRLR